MLDGNAVPEVFYEVCVRAKKSYGESARARERETESVRERELCCELMQGIVSIMGCFVLTVAGKAINLKNRKLE